MTYLRQMSLRSFTLLLITLLASLVLTLALLKTAQAQAPEDGSDVKAPPAAIEPIAPYDTKLKRLSEVLGSLHYLRALCGADEGTKWRDMMAEIVKLEKPGPKRRARLISSFNRGYRAFDGTYSACTPSALLAAERYIKEGAALSAQITSRYGR